MRLCRSCATLQCQMFENTIISDRAEKDAKRRQVERDTLELKSALKVKGSTTEAVLLHHCLGRKWPKKVGWGGVAQAKDRQSLCLSCGAGTKPALSAGLKRERMGSSQSPRATWGRACHTSPMAWVIQGGSQGSSTACPLATSALRPDVEIFSISSTAQLLLHGPGAPPAAGERRRDALAIELHHVPREAISPKTPLSLSLSLFQVQSWWRGTMVRRYLGPYQALAKLRQRQLQLPSEKGKEKSGAKKKAR